jgi:hypothetical protein
VGGSTADRSYVERSFAFACFFSLLAANVILFSPHIAGVPIRCILSAGMLVLSASVFPNDALAVMRKNVLVLLLAGGLALEGTFVSIVNGAPINAVAEQVLEVHVQTAIVILATAILARVCGARACVWALVAVVGLTTFVAILQMLHVQPAWNLRAHLGAFARSEDSPDIIDNRPTGLSFSPIELTTQICVAFAAFAVVRDRQLRLKTQLNKPDLLILGALGALVVGSFASGTRAPILGGLIFLALYAALRRSSWLVLLLVCGGLLMYILWPILLSIIQSSAPRVVSTDDNSVAARAVFAYYGARLFIDNPLGYGLTFDPTQMWTKYWSDLYMMQGAAGAEIHPLHDYLNSMMNIYGIGIFLFIPLAAKVLKGTRQMMIFFIPYMVQIMFHNSGPFYNDVILYFTTAAISVAPGAPQTAANGWKRARAMRYVPAAARTGRRFGSGLAVR